MRTLTFKDENMALGFVNMLYWGNGAGSCRQAEFAVRCAESGMSVVMYGTTTFDSRVGNTGGDFYYDPKTKCSVNAYGMPNRGHKAEMETLSALKGKINAHGAKLGVSISTGDIFIPDEISQMATDIVTNEAADIIEWNGSCPNVEVGGKRKPGVCFSPVNFEAGVKALCAAAPHMLVSAKIAPITEASLLGELADICVKNRVNFIVCSNTDGNCYLENEEGKPALPGMILGGLGGAGLRPKVCGMIKILAPKLRGTSTRIIATGGTEIGTHAYKYLSLGEGMVVGFQFTTAIVRRNEDLRFVSTLISGELNGERGLTDLLVEKGITWE